MKCAECDCDGNAANCTWIRSNTAMTMPEKAYLEDVGSDGDSGVWGCEWQSDKDTAYIRSDIVEELVRAMHGVRHYVDGVAGSDEQDAFDSALTRINAIMEGK